MKRGAYGIVYQNIMRNLELPGNAKLIYAYLAVFAGSNDECYPSIETICKELHMTKTTMYKYMNVLVEYGVVEKKQTFVGNLKGKVIYKITHEIIKKDWIPKNSKTEKNVCSDSEKIGIRKYENPSISERNNKNINSNNINNNNNKERYEQPEVAKSLNPPKKNNRFIPPTVEEVRQYCIENNYSLDAQRFVDFYECKGWMVGKNKMKNWKAAVRTWVRKDQEGVKKDEPREKSHSVQLWD